MFFRHLKNVLSRQDNSKTNLRCLEDVLRWLGMDIRQYSAMFRNTVGTLRHTEAYLGITEAYRAIIRHIWNPA